MEEHFIAASGSNFPVYGRDSDLENDRSAAFLRVKQVPDEFVVKEATRSTPLPNPQSEQSTLVNDPVIPTNKKTVVKNAWQQKKYLKRHQSRDLPTNCHSEQERQIDKQNNTWVTKNHRNRKNVNLKKRINPNISHNGIRFTANGSEQEHKQLYSLNQDETLSRIEHNQSVRPTTIDKNIQNDFKLEKLILEHNKLLSLQHADCDDILSTLEMVELNEFLDTISAKDSDLVALYLTVVSNACNSKHQSKIASLLSGTFQSKNFIFSCLVQYLSNFEIAENDVNSSESLVSLVNILEIYMDFSPATSSQILPVILPLLKQACSKILVDDKLNDLKDRLSTIEKHKDYFTKDLSYKEIKQISAVEQMNCQPPPDDFRQISILPIHRDINEHAPFLRPNIIKGNYFNVEHYLDVQFRLLREDYIKPLREAISKIKYLKAVGKPILNCDDYKIYKDVHITKEEIKWDDVLHTAIFDKKQFREIDWERSKRLKIGTLLCLSSNHFETAIFASVADRNFKELREGSLMLKIEDCSEVFSIRPTESFIALETSGYFEAYRHNLMVLKNMYNHNFPFKKYIISLVENNSMPTYLKQSTKYDISPLLKPIHPKEKTYHNATYITPSLDCQWLSKDLLGLDESQYSALKAGLTRELSIIQGPPGTGKTYIGLKIMQMLLHNFDIWNHECRPILIVCYTNHALDQFLEGIVEFTDKIARIGGRCSNKALDNYALKNLKRRRNYKNSIAEKITKREFLNNCKCEIKKISIILLDIFDYTLTAEDSKHVMEEHHYSSLCNYTWDHRGYWKCEFLLLRWLDRNSETKENENSVERINEEKNELKQQLYILVSLTEEEVAKIDDIWAIDKNMRLRLYKYWLQSFVRTKKQKMYEMQAQIQEQVNRLQSIKLCEDFIALNDSKVIGMTTTGAAKNRELIEALKPKIVIVEEAAEIFETHVLTALTEHVEHVILIGDHEQLRPNPNVYELSMKYHLDVSLFERLVKNGLHYCQLMKQRRMRPEICELLVPHIYENLINHESVYEYESIKGVLNNLYFVSHRYPEESESDSTSKFNMHEAKFIVALCEYLLKQGYGCSQITILVTYAGQLSVVKMLAKKLNGVRISAVDDFQGEENDIILLSFVRSNEDRKIGFLKVSNRVCVALSRAKKGLFCIGNFKLFMEESALWKNILLTLGKNNAVGPSLKLQCQNHPNVITNVSSDKDFMQVPEGGCTQPCDFRLNCGHTCTLLCHPYDRDHSNFKCKKKCTKMCDRQHLCPKMCFEECDPCKVLVSKVLPICQHIATIKCFKDPDKHICKRPCEKILECGHECKLICGKYCREVLCRENVTKVVPKCEHNAVVECHVNIETYVCPLPCEKILPCGHTCRHICGKKCSEKNCKTEVTKIVPNCGHNAKVKCNVDIYTYICPLPCEKILPCGHTCKRICSKDCSKKTCKRKVTKIGSKCEHIVVVECHINMKNYICLLPCEKILPCGHKCKKICGEYCCEKLCQENVEKILPECGHIFTLKCNTDLKTFICPALCSRILLCGHKCNQKCGEICTEEKCERKVLVNLLCNHKKELNCNLSKKANLFKTCKEKCNTILACGHVCTGTCSECFQKRLHRSCQQRCQRILICGHQCELLCSVACRACTQKCKNYCSHRRCFNPCGMPCLKCNRKCVFSCEHAKCDNLCSELCSNSPCDKPCKKILKCGHECSGLCSQQCLECSLCDEKVIICNKMSKSTSRLIIFEDCDHIFNLNDLSIRLNSCGNDKIEMKRCPECATIIRKNRYFNNIIKTQALKFEEVKKAIFCNFETNENVKRSIAEKVQQVRSVMRKKVFAELDAHTIIEICEYCDKCCKSKSFPGWKQNELAPINSDVNSDLLRCENILNILLEILNVCKMCTFDVPPSTINIYTKNVIVFTQGTREIIFDYICQIYQNASDEQLEDLSWEVYRLKLLHQVSQLFEEKIENFILAYRIFVKVVENLCKFEPFREAEDEIFNCSFRELSKILSCSEFIQKEQRPLLNIINVAVGPWYECPYGNVYSHPKSAGKERCRCTKCVQSANKSSTHQSFEYFVRQGSTGSAPHVNTNISQPVNRVITQPESRSFVPPVSRSFVPPVSRSLAPLINGVIKQPDSRSLAPPVSKNITQPANRSLAAPSVNRNIAPVVNRNIAPPVSRTLAPPVSRTLAPPVSRTLAPPVSRTLAPPVSRTLAPSVSRTLAPSVSRSLAPSVSRTLAPPVSRTLAPHVSRTWAPPVSRTLASPVSRSQLASGSLTSSASRNIIQPASKSSPSGHQTVTVNKPQSNCIIL